MVRANIIRPFHVMPGHDESVPGLKLKGAIPMILSRERILTTHVGSLPRNEKLSDLLVRQEAGETFDPAEMTAELDRAVKHVVDKQTAAGIDVGNDGEQQRVGFQTYIPQRMSGFGGVSQRRRSREIEEFPELLASLMRRFPHVTKGQQGSPQAQAEISTSSRWRTRSRASSASPTTALPRCS